jgi:hypothetical protein
MLEVVKRERRGDFEKRGGDAVRLAKAKDLAAKTREEPIRRCSGVVAAPLIAHRG